MYITSKTDGNRYVLHVICMYGLHVCMFVALSKWKYRVIYEHYFGGVTSFTKAMFVKINGFSNQFWGWGREDDNLRHRVLNAGLREVRLPPEIGR